MTIASILRLAFMINRFYFDGLADNDLFTEYQVNTISFVPPSPLPVNSFSPYFSFKKKSSPYITKLILSPSFLSPPKKNSTVEIDVAIICACLPTLKAFLKRFAPRLLGSSSSPESHRKPSAYASFHYNKNSGAGIGIGTGTGRGGRVDRKWKDESHEECLTMNAGGGGHDGGLEDETDGKSRESYAMGEIGVVTVTG